MLESQKILLQLLKEIDEICKQHDITYYLIGGTALGAVRHHGFIPWDDDADIVMDHDNYMKFVDVMSDPSNLPANRAYKDPFMEPYTHINSFGRYFTTDTSWFIRPYCLCDHEQGIRIDVFHLIPCPDEGPEREEFLRKFRIWGELCYPYARNKETNVEDWLSSVESLERSGVEKVKKSLFDDLHIERYTDSSQYLYCYEKEHTFYDKGIFAEPVYFPFEDTVLPVPTKYRDHFRILFGDDWYRIPEVAERESHSAVQDIHRGYEEYTADYDRYVLSKEDLPFKDYKLYMFKNWEKQWEVDQQKKPIRKKLVERRVDIFWQSHADEVRNCFEEGNYKETLELLKPYYDEQFGGYAVNNDLFFNVDKELLRYVVASCLYTSDNKKARRLLSIIPSDEMDDDLRALQDYLKEKDALTFMEEGDASDPEVYESNEMLLRSHQNDRDLLRRKAKLILKMERADDYQEVERICHRFPDDGDFICILAELSEKRGQTDQAIARYKDAVQHTRNGMVITECELSIERLKKGRK